MVPWLGVGINPMIANRAVLMDQLGCQDSGWWPDIERQIFLPISNLPLGCKKIAKSKSKRHTIKICNKQRQNPAENRLLYKKKPALLSAFKRVPI